MNISRALNHKITLLKLHFCIYFFSGRTKSIFYFQTKTCFIFFCFGVYFFYFLFFVLLHSDCHYKRPRLLTRGSEKTFIHLAVIS